MKPVCHGRLAEEFPGGVEPGEYCFTGAEFRPCSIVDAGPDHAAQLSPVC